VLFVVVLFPQSSCGAENPKGRHSMHFKRIPVTFIQGDVIASMIFARALSLLPLPIGCLASR